MPDLIERKAVVAMLRRDAFTFGDQITETEKTLIERSFKAAALLVENFPASTRYAELERAASSFLAGQDALDSIVQVTIRSNICPDDYNECVYLLDRARDDLRAALANLDKEQGNEGTEELDDC